MLLKTVTNSNREGHDAVRGRRVGDVKDFLAVKPREGQALRRGQPGRQLLREMVLSCVLVRPAAPSSRWRRP